MRTIQWSVLICMAVVVIAWQTPDAKAALLHRWGFDEAASSTAVADSVGSRTGTFEGQAVGQVSDSVAYIDPGEGITGNAVRLKWVRRSVADLNNDQIDTILANGANSDAGRVNLGPGYDGGQGGLRLNQAITVSGWFRFNPLPEYDPNASGLRATRWYLWNNGTEPLAGGASTHFHRAQTYNNLIDIASMSTGATGPGSGDPADLPYNTVPGFDFYDGQWHHIVWTQTADDPNTGGRIDEVIESIYVDGVLAANTRANNVQEPAVEDDLVVTYLASQADWFLGGVNTTNRRGPAGLYDGWIDEFRIYDEALGASAVAELYNTPHLGFVPEPATLALLAIGSIPLLRRRPLSA